MILIGLGANLDHPRFGSPRATCEVALRRLSQLEVSVPQLSRWYRSAPVPASDQPWFVNAVAEIVTDLPPQALLALLHEVECELGRRRRLRNEARILDLDLLAYGDHVSPPDAQPALPHPRLCDRGFVVLPLCDIAPHWCHPVTGISARELARRLPPDQIVEPLP